VRAEGRVNGSHGFRFSFALLGRKLFKSAIPFMLSMNESFDIFRREIDGSFVWVGAAESFALARQKVVQDPASLDREFLIVNALTGEKMVVEPPERPPVESPA